MSTLAELRRSILNRLAMLDALADNFAEIGNSMVANKLRKIVTCIASDSYEMVEIYHNEQTAQVQSSMNELGNIMGLVMKMDKLSTKKV